MGSLVYAQSEEKNIDFQSFLEGFDTVSLPANVAVNMIFSGSSDPETIDSSFAAKYLPIHITDNIFEIEGPGQADYYYGFIAWQSGSQPWHKSKHIALVWYAAGTTSNSYSSIAEWGYLTTFTEDGKMVSNQLISYYEDFFNGETVVSSWLSDWLSEWSILTRHSECSRSLNMDDPCTVNYALNIVFENGSIESN